MLAYLCSPTDQILANGDALWRRKLAPFLRDDLGHRVHDPSVDAFRALTEDEHASLRHWQTTDLDRFRRAVRKMLAFNLDLLEHKADYLICYWGGPESRYLNAPAEAAAAYRKGIPVYLVTSLPVEEIDRWALGCSDQVFASIEDLKKFLSMRFSREKQTQFWKE